MLLLIPLVLAITLTFTAPTLSDGSYTSGTDAIINMTIDMDANALDTFKFNWNGTNYSIYDSNLVLGLNFNNNSAIGENSTYAVDISKYGNNGTIYGAVWNSSGKYGSAMDFDGVNDYVDCGNDTSLDITDAITIEAWVKPTFTGNHEEIVDKRSSYIFGFNDYNGQNILRFIYHDGTAYRFARSPNAYPENEWIHVVATQIASGGNTLVKLYKNGVLDHSETLTGRPQSNSVSTMIGTDSGVPYNEWFNGTIDEVRIYNRSLSADEISMHYQSEFQKYNSTQYRFYNNITDLTDRTYTYYGWANDTAGNTNQSETRTLSVDLNAPEFTNLANKSIYDNETLSYDIDASDGTGVDCFAVNDTANFNINCSGYLTNATGLNAGIYWLNITVNDTLGNENYGIIYVNVTAVPDTTYPQFSNYLETPANNSDYSFGQNYEFNVTITSTNGTAGIEFDGTNYTLTNSSNVFTKTFSSLSAGTYSYYYWAYGNGTENNYNVSETRSYVLNKAVPQGSVSGTSPITYGTAGDVQGTETNNGDGDISYKLYREGVEVSNPDTTTLGVGTYNYIYNATSGQNYTSNSSIGTFSLTVNQATSSVNLTLGGVHGNTSINEDTSINLNCSIINGDSGAYLVLYNNGTLINNGTSPIGNITLFSEPGNYNITCIYENTQNYSTSSETWWLEVNDTTSPTITLIPPTNNTGDNDGNITFNYNVTDDSNIANCSLIFNNQLNKTNSSITKDTTQNFTLNNLAAGSYNWSVNCTDSLKNIGASETRTISVAKTTEFSGDTTNLSAVNLSNITNLIIDQPSHGKINFSEIVDLSSGGDINTHVNISFNRIEINSTALPALNKSARLKLYNLTYSNPRVLKNIEKYDKIIFQKCNENKIHFIPLFNLINESDLSDGLHPNTKGHEKIYNYIKAYLSKHL